MKQSLSQKIESHTIKPVTRAFILFLLAIFTSIGSAQAKWLRRMFSDPEKKMYTQATLPRMFPARAKRGKIRFLRGGEVKIGRKRTRLSPAARIRDSRNMRLNAHVLAGKKFHVMYTEDTMHQISDVWILSDLEVKRPSPQQQRDQILRSQGINPKSFDIDPLTPYHKLPKFPGN